MSKPTRYLYVLTCGHSCRSEKKRAEDLYCMTCDDRVPVKVMHRSLFAVGEELK